MKQTISLALVLTLFSFNLFGQSNPTPFDLGTGNYSFTTWSEAEPAGTYPPNMVFHQHLSTSNPEFGDEPDSDWQCVYNLESRSRINGLGSNGFVFINTNTAQDEGDCGSLITGRNLGAAVLALNTIGRKDINVAFQIVLNMQGLGEPDPRHYHLRFQYRIGETGSWEDFSTPVIFSSENKNDNDFEDFSETLPEFAENQAIVELRWLYYEVSSNDGGARPRIAINEINVSSVSDADPSISASPITPLNFQTDVGTPSSASSISVVGTNLTDNISVNVTPPFEVAASESGPYDNTLTLQQSGGDFGPEDIFIRYNPANSGPHTGELTLQSPVADNFIIDLSGNTTLSGLTPSVFINEFMASNSTTFADETNAFEDWIELYNAEDTAVDVGNYYITDDLSNPTKFQLSPSAATVIPAKGFILIWASGEPSRGPLHTNFKLSASEGEQIGLYAPDGITVIDSITFGPQTTDVSQGRLPDGNDIWVFFNNPTPGISNNPSSVEEKELFAQVQFFPNPAQDQLQFTNTTGKKLIAELYDVSGRIVQTVPLDRESSTVDISAMQKGVYFVKMRFKETGRFFVRRLVIQ